MKEMMETYEDLGKTLYQEAIAATSILGLPCKIGCDAFEVPASGLIYGEFWFRTGVTFKMRCGGTTDFPCTVGLLQFTLRAPPNNGERGALRLGKQLKQAFNRKKFEVQPDGRVKMGTVRVQALGIYHGHAIVIVDASFHYFHRPFLFDSVSEFNPYGN